MSETAFDLVVMGAGPGGYVAAIRASQLGMKTAIIEREHLGGVCLNWGCIPTKTLLKSAELYHAMQHAEPYGIKVGNVTVNLPQMVKRSREVAEKLSGGIRHLMKKNKITVIEGAGKLGPSSPNGRDVYVQVDGPRQVYSGRNVILATGARPRVLAGLEPDGKLIWTSREAMVPKELPKTLAIIGSGAIGIEFASFYKMLGSQVTVVEMVDKILPAEDDEISALARKTFEKQGIAIHTSTTVKTVKKGKDHVTLTLASGDKTWDITVDRVIVAAGIIGNVENIGLEGTKIKIEKTHVVTDGYSFTGEPNVYAIGDLTGPPWLAHKASHEAIICVDKIAGKNDVHPLDATKIPGCTYCYPQVASVGLSEKRAKEKGYQVRVGRFPYMANGKAIALGETEGLIKTVFDAKTGELLGAHLFGAEVTELVQGFAIARTLETTEADLMHTVFPHPTLSEMMHEATLDAYGRVIHF